MAEDRRRTIPGAGQAGLVRYFDEEESGIRLDPKHVIAAAIILIFLVTLSHLYI